MVGGTEPAAAGTSREEQRKNERAKRKGGVQRGDPAGEAIVTVFRAGERVAGAISSTVSWMLWPAATGSNPPIEHPVPDGNAALAEESSVNDAFLGSWRYMGDVASFALHRLMETANWQIGPKGATAMPVTEGAPGQCTIGPDGLQQCPGKVDPQLPPISIANFRKVAREKFSMELSPSLKKREDKTLRNVVVLIADERHKDPSAQTDLTSLVRGSVVYGDLLLVETPPEDKEGMKVLCRHVDDLGVRCRGIDIGRDVAFLRKLERKYIKAMARMSHAVVGKTVLWRGPLPTLQQLVDMGQRELEDLLNAHVSVMNAGGEAKFTTQELTQLVELHRSVLATGEEYQQTVAANNPNADVGFRTELARYADEANGRAVFSVLGGLHVDHLKSWLLENFDAIVLYPKQRPW